MPGEPSWPGWTSSHRYRPTAHHEDPRSPRSSRRGLVYGATDDFSYNLAENGVHVHDLQATILQLLGVEHERLTYFHQGRYRLTDVHGKVVAPPLAGVLEQPGWRTRRWRRRT